MSSTNPNAAPATPLPDDSNKLSTIWIVAIAVVSALVVGVAILVLYGCWHRSRMAKKGGNYSKVELENGIGHKKSPSTSTLASTAYPTSTNAPATSAWEPAAQAGYERDREPSRGRDRALSDVEGSFSDLGRPGGYNEMGLMDGGGVWDDFEQARGPRGGQQHQQQPQPPPQLYQAYQAYPGGSRSGSPAPQHPAALSVSVPSIKVESASRDGSPAREA